MTEQTSSTCKHPLIIILLSIGILVLCSTVLLLHYLEHSHTLTYPIDTKNLSKAQVEVMVNKYLIPILQKIGGRILKINYSDKLTEQSEQGPRQIVNI